MTIVDRLKPYFDKVLEVLEDKKITAVEAFQLVQMIPEAVAAVIEEIDDFGDDDEIAVREALIDLYVKEVEPRVNFPGPDVPWDFVMKRVIIPGAVGLIASQIKKI